MRAFKRTAAFLLLNILLAGILQLALREYPYYEDRPAEYYSGDYNTVVIGSSFNSNLAYSELEDGEQIYSMWRPGINFLDYYYIVKELNTHKPLKRIYMDFSLEYWLGGAGDSNSVNMMKILTGENRLDYLVHVLGKEDYNSAFFTYRLTGPALREIPETLSKKFRAFSAREENTEQPVYVQQTTEVDRHLIPTIFSPELISEEAVRQFRMLADYCTENNIDLVVFATAFAKERLLAENTGDVHDYFTKFFRDNHVRFYDMNYVKGELFPRTTEEYVDVHGHMRYPLAVRQTRLLRQIMESDHPETFFVDSYQEVLAGIEGMEDTAA